MVLFRKLQETFSAKINAILNSAVTPEEKILLVDEKFREQIGYMRTALVEVRAGKDIATRKRDTIQAQINQMQKSAETAVKNGRDDLASAVLQRKIPLQTSVDSLTSTIVEMDGKQKTLEADLDKMQVEYTQFSAKKAEVIGRFRAAKAQTEAFQSIRNIGTRVDNIRLGIQDATDAVDEMEARADALHDVSTFGTTTGAYKDKVTQEIEELSKNADIEAELSKIKEKVGTAKAAP